MGAFDAPGRTVPFKPHPLLLDQLRETQAWAAYSVARKLRLAYRGAAFQVRRSSDSATLDIGFLRNKVNVPQLLAFCGTGNGFVAKLYDQSGKGNDQLQSTTASQPQIVASGVLQKTINGSPACNGGQMNCTLTTALPASLKIMRVLAATVNTGGTSAARLCSFLASGQANDFGNTLSFNIAATNTSGQVSITRGATKSSFNGLLNAPIVVAACINSSNTFDLIYENFSGSLAASLTDVNTFGTAGKLNFHNDGWNGAGTGEPWTGYTSEMIVCPVMSVSKAAPVSGVLDLTADFGLARILMCRFFKAAP